MGIFIMRSRKGRRGRSRQRCKSVGGGVVVKINVDGLLKMFCTPYLEHVKSLGCKRLVPSLPHDALATSLFALSLCPKVDTCALLIFNSINHTRLELLKYKTPHVLKDNRPTHRYRPNKQVCNHTASRSQSHFTTTTSPASAESRDSTPRIQIGSETAASTALPETTRRAFQFRRRLNCTSLLIRLATTQRTTISAQTRDETLKQNSLTA